MAQRAQMPTWTALTTASQLKARQYDDKEWSRMRPIFQQLYIDQDLSLKDVLLELRREHDVHVSMNMCKRRLRSWGMTKNVTAARKAEVLRLMLDQGPAAALAYSDIRPDKMVRYQKQCDKQARLAAVNHGRTDHDTHILPAAQDQNHSKSERQASTVMLHQSNRGKGPTYSLALPEESAYTYASLHAVTDMMLWQGAANKERSSSAYIKVGNWIQDGMSLWEVNASTAARLMFYQAAEAIQSQLQHGIALDARFVYYLCPEVWSARSNQHFDQLRWVLGRLVDQYLGSAHPMSLVIRSFEQLKTGHARLRVWDCLLDHYVKPEEHGAIWWDFAKARWQYCRRIGLFQDAADSCERALAVMRGSRKATIRMEVDVLMELTRLSFKLSRYNAAMKSLQDLLRLAQNHCSHCERVMPLALLYLAQLHEINLNLNEAQKCLEHRLKVVLHSDGMQGAQTLRCCRDLLCFQQRHPDFGAEHPNDDRYDQVCRQLEEMTEGYWEFCLDSGGSNTARTKETQTHQYYSVAHQLNHDLVEIETYANDE